MSEKRLSFIIDPSKAKTGADKIKGYLGDIASQADKIQKSLNFGIKGGPSGGLDKPVKDLGKTPSIPKEVTSEFAKFEKQLEDVRKRLAFYNTESGKQLILERQKAAELVKTTKAQASGTKELTAAEKAYERIVADARDYNTNIGKSTQFLRQNLRQQKAYQASLIDTLSSQQKLTLAETAQQKKLDDLRRSLSLMNTEVARSISDTQAQISTKSKLAAVQNQLSQSYTKEYQELLKARQALAERKKELLGTNKAMSESERASANLAKSLQFWRQRQKDLNSEQYQTLIRLRESSRQLEAYQKSMVNAISPAQRLAKSQQELRNNIRDTISQIRLASSVDGKRNTELRAQLSLQKQLAQSEARLKQAYTEEYAQLLRNNEAIKKRRRELLGLDDAHRRAGLSASQLSIGMSALTGALGTFTGGYLVAELVRVADAYTNIQNKLAVVSDSNVNLTGATRDLLNISIEARTDLESTMDVYSKLIRVTKGLTVSQKDLYGITETVSKAVAMSGASAQGAQGALLQFSQALSGDFQAAAQELNSIIEQTPALASLIADALNSVDSSLNANIGNLKRLASEGKISTESLIQGIINVKSSIDDQFNNSIRTVSQSLTSLKDAFAVLVGEVDRAFGGTNSLASSLVDLSKSLADLAPQILGVTAGLTTMVGLIGAGGFAALMIALGPIAIGFTALSAAIAGVTGKYVEAKTRANLLAQANKELDATNKALKSSAEDVGNAYKESSISEILDKYSEIEDRIQDAQDKLEDARNKAEEARVRYLESGIINAGENKAALDSQLEQVAKFENQITILKSTLGELSGVMDDAFNNGSVVKGLRTQELAVKDVVESLKSEINAQDTANRKNAEAKVLMNAYAKAKEMGVDVTTDFVKSLLQEEELISSVGDELQAQKEAFEALRSSIDPVYKVQQDFNKAMDTLNDSVSESDPLWNDLASTIRNNYTKALEEASRQTTLGLQGLQNKLRETTEYLSSRVQGGQDTGAVSMENITRSRNDGPERRTSSSFEGMAADFVKKLDQGILGPKGAAEMLVGLRTYADKLGNLGEGFDVEGMKGAVMNLAAMAKESFGTEDLSDLSVDELAQVFEKAQQEAKEREANDLRIREENNTYLQQIAEWATSQKDAESSPSMGTINISVNTDKGSTASGQVSGETDFLRKLASTLSGVSSAV